MNQLRGHSGVTGIQGVTGLQGITSISGMTEFQGELSFHNGVFTRKCPVHGEVTETISLNFTGLNETYCLFCISEFLKKFIRPLEDSETEPLQRVNSEDTLSRYQIIKRNKTC